MSLVSIFQVGPAECQALKAFPRRRSIERLSRLESPALKHYFPLMAEPAWSRYLYTSKYTVLSQSLDSDFVQSSRFHFMDDEPDSAPNGLWHSLRSSDTPPNNKSVTSMNHTSREVPSIDNNAVSHVVGSATRSGIKHVCSLDCAHRERLRRRHRSVERPQRACVRMMASRHASATSRFSSGSLL